MKVFRIETNKGRGICAATGSHLCTLYNISSKGNENEHCSLPHKCWVAIEDAENQGAVPCFAFPTIDALKTWFPEARGRKAMEMFGAHCHVYEVEQTLGGTEYQCVFDKNKAKLIETIDLAKLY